MPIQVNETTNQQQEYDEESSSDSAVFSHNDAYTYQRLQAQRLMQ